MKGRILFLVMAGILLNSWMWARAPLPGGESPPAKIDFKGYDNSGSNLGIVYAIPYAGMVEFRIFDAEGTLVWREQYVREKGEHKLNLKQSAFKPNQSYSIQMNYKQDEIKRELALPHK
ncbi:MAG: hypothetical protein H6581_19815 [Bacteroidia bacterium]|nr:hypothetical protein [Bacteroidia bacterium]